MLPISNIRNGYGLSMAVIIEACRVHFGKTSLESLNELLNDPSVNYQEIALHTRLHRIRPVVFRILLQANCPDIVKARLTKELHSITLKNFSLAKETERITQRLGELGVTAIPYKGVAYSLQFYGDISMRESSDIDLVIEAADLEKTFPFFEGDGYMGLNVEGFKRMNKELFYKQQKDFSFDKRSTSADSFHVELHWKILHPNFCAPSALGEFDKANLALVPLLETPRKFFSNEEHIRAVLLHHWIHDGFEYLKTFLDIAQGLFLVETTSKTNLTAINTHNGLSIATYCIEQLFGIEGKLSLAKSEIVEKAGSNLIEFNLGSTAGKRYSGITLNLINQYRRSFRNQVQFLPGLFAKMRFFVKFWGGLLRPKQGDLEMVGLPKAIGFFYFFIRPIRIVLRSKSSIKNI